MTAIAGIGFAAPWLLLALAALPALWLILRAIPPAPRRVAFAGVTLLLGLKDDESVSERTPWWLMLLRMLAVAALITGLAGPVLDPRDDAAGDGPLLLVLDASWASGPAWDRRVAWLETRLDAAESGARPVSILLLSDPRQPNFRGAAEWRSRLPGLEPSAWMPGPNQVSDAIGMIGELPDGTETVWLTDGLDFAGRDDLVQALRDAGGLRVVDPGETTLGLRPAGFRDGSVILTLLRETVAGADSPDESATGASAGSTDSGASGGSEGAVSGDGRDADSGAATSDAGATQSGAGEVAEASLGEIGNAGSGATVATVLARGLDPAGVERILARAEARFDPGAGLAEATMTLPAELRNRITRFEIDGVSSAGAVSLADDGLRRREIALAAGREDREGLELLSPLHYLRRALEPNADLLEGPLSRSLTANPDVVVLADVARLSPAEAEDLGAWVESGGLLLRFAGPRMAASDVSREAEDPLMPVRLRAGGRAVGGAMSWGSPKELAPFDEDSPFFGLEIPTDVTVSRQVMAQPDPTLSERVIAQLADGTPLATRKPLGRGSIVLVHVTANAEWSTLPLSGLFVEMLERLAVSTSGRSALDAEDLEGTVWRPLEVLDGRGGLRDAGALTGVEGRALAEDPVGPGLHPGLYESGDRRLARNAIGSADDLRTASWPVGVPVSSLDLESGTRLGGPLLALAAILLALDVLATLVLAGRLVGAGGGAAISASSAAATILAAPALVASLALAAGPGPARAMGADEIEAVERVSAGSHSHVASSETASGSPEKGPEPEADAFWRLAQDAGSSSSPSSAPASQSAGRGEDPESAPEAYLRAANTLTLAYVLTGDTRLDSLAEAGLRGIGGFLSARTSVEPGPPVGVDVESDELAFYPLIYWPVSPDQEVPSPTAYAKLNEYMRSGGMIVLDTRDAHIAGSAGTTPEARKLRQLAANLDLPPLEPVPGDHVMTRAFYLLGDFPGRHQRGSVWVEAAPPDAERIEGMPFRNLNDGVTPVVILGNDWIGAWAHAENGRPLLPVGGGLSGERRREMAIRVGVNLVMYALSGNYKSDQVHVPALLERLGQ